MSSYSQYNRIRQQMECCCVGPTGPIGPTSLIPYESGPVSHVQTERILDTQIITYIAFFAPSSGSYKDALLYTTIASAASYTGTIGVAIYNSTSDKAGPPTTKIGQGTISHTAENIRNKFQSITFDSAISLTANKLYWFAFAADNAVGTPYVGTHTDSSSILDLCYYEMPPGFTGATFPHSATIAGQSVYVVWFRIN